MPVDVAFVTPAVAVLVPIIAVVNLPISVDIGGGDDLDHHVKSVTSQQLYIGIMHS